MKMQIYVTLLIGFFFISSTCVDGFDRYPRFLFRKKKTTTTTTTTTAKPQVFADRGIANLILKRTTTRRPHIYGDHGDSYKRPGGVQIPIERHQSHSSYPGQHSKDISMDRYGSHKQYGQQNKDYRRPGIGFNKENHCSPNPCENDGVCTSLTTTYICRCMKGYYGMKCEKRFNSGF